MSHLHTPVGAGDHVEGPADAKVTLVEYGDYQCPMCGEAFPVVKDIVSRYGDQLRFVFRNFPIPELHDQAVNAANVAEFCASKDQFWAAHDALYENQDALGPDLYEQIASQLGLDASAMMSAVENGEYNQRIQDDIDSGLRSGVNGTPAFYINGQKFEIMRSFGELDQAISEALNS